MGKKCKIVINPGDRFGKLTIVERADDYIVENERSKTTIIRYLCKCDCGNEVIKYKSQLVSGTGLSCGCDRGKSESKTQPKIKHVKTDKEVLEDYFSTRESCVGKKFGRLNVIDAFVRSENNHQHVYYKCVCDCGNKVDITPSDLKHKRRSCGCSRTNIKDLSLIDKCFGDLKVIGKDEKSRWICKCKKGHICYKTTKQLKSGITECHVCFKCTPAGKKYLHTKRYYSLCRNLRIRNFIDFTGLYIGPYFVKSMVDSFKLEMPDNYDEFCKKNPEELFDFSFSNYTHYYDCSYICSFSDGRKKDVIVPYINLLELYLKEKTAVEYISYDDYIYSSNPEFLIADILNTIEVATRTEVQFVYDNENHIVTNYDDKSKCDDGPLGHCLFDFVLYDSDKEKIIAVIEYNGKQHYEPVGFKPNDFGNLIKRDEHKKQFVHDVLKVPMLIIPYTVSEYQDIFDTIVKFLYTEVEYYR